MAQEQPTNVMAAFEMLLEEVETEVELVNNAGAQAFMAENYERVEAAKSQALQLTDFRQKLADLRRQWPGLTAAFNPEGDGEVDAETTAARRDLGRLKRGMRTPEDAFRRPILQVLAERGGKGPIREVLEQVEKMMQGTLQKADYETLPSTPTTPRWYNTAQWARNSMVKEGLLHDDSRRGIWEISEDGLAYLARHQS